MEKDHLIVILERMESKIELVVEGHEALRSEIQALSQKTDERFDLVDFKINVLNAKIDSVEQSLGKRIDAVASDLKAHRFDTEAHLKGYQVREE